MPGASTHPAEHPWGPATSPYLQIGEASGVRELVDAFYDLIESDSPVLRAMLPEDTTESREKLFEFLSGWMGGPPLYWERRGHPALRMRHSPFAIGVHEAEEWTRCMAAATERLGLPAPLARFLVAELGKAALQLRNR
jgi:hemoglobin